MIVFRSDSRGEKLSSLPRSEASTISTGGSPSRLAAFEMGKLSPVSAAMASSACFTE